MNLAALLGFGSDVSTARNAQLDAANAPAAWGAALVGYTSLAAEAQREAISPFAGIIDPFGQGSRAGQLAWATQSRATYEMIMPVRIEYFLRPDQMAPRRVPQMGPYDQTEQRAAALQAALVADMLATKQAPQF